MLGEVGLLVLQRRPFSCVTYVGIRAYLATSSTWQLKRTAKERLYLHTTDAANLAGTHVAYMRVNLR